MKKFINVSSPEELRRFASGLDPLGEEVIPLEDGLGRVLSEEIHSAEDLPPFRRSVMDGYAVMARDTVGASSSAPAYLQNIGEVFIGNPASLDIGPGKCCRIPTGGMLPASGDAVVMIEYTRELSDGLVEMTTSVSPGENMVDIGEDTLSGTLVLKRGKIVRPQEIGILAGLGVLRIKVYRRVEVAILSTGDELVEPADKPATGQIRNVNQYSLMAHVMAAGGRPHLLGIAPDDRRSIFEKVRAGLERADVVLISGGSSVGTRDLTAGIINELGEPGILFHGVSVRPGKPTILGQAGRKIIFGLPGHPVSAMVSFINFVRPVIHALSGIKDYRSDHPVEAILEDNIHSRPGREDFVQVTLEEDGGGRLRARPIFKKSGMVTSMVSADGYIIIPVNVEGLEAGEPVQVHLYRPVLR